jgi:NOL1/NOP2/fmu family ribosome biogenesis protein
MANVEIVGMYLLKSDGSFRLSFDATQIFGNDVKKNVVEINDEQMKVWMKGGDVEIAEGMDKGIFVVKNGEDYLGCGISDGKKIINHVPKERRSRR